MKPIPVSTDPSVILPAVGPYPVTITAENGKTRTVTASVVDGDTEHNKDEAVYAHSFLVQLDDVKNLTDEKVIELANAFGWSKDNGENLDLTVDYSAIKEEVGPYFPVTFTTENGTTRSVTASVVNDDVEVTPETEEELLYATDFELKVSEVPNLSKKVVDEKANAKAWNKKDGSTVAFTTDHSKIEAKPGQYPVTFKTAKGLTRTVTATVNDDAAVNPPEIGVTGAMSYTILALVLAIVISLLVFTKRKIKKQN
ncbi:MAG: hypothetical protein ACRCUP_01105 [Mycoplasmatales bacterium]